MRKKTRLGTAAAVLAAWAALVLTSPRWTAPFRPCLEAAMASALGKPAQVQGLRLGWTGSVVFTGVQGEADWGAFEAPELRLRVSFLSLLLHRDLVASLKGIQLLRPSLSLKSGLRGGGSEAWTPVTITHLPELSIQGGRILVPQIHPNIPLSVSGSFRGDGGRLEIQPPAGGRVLAEVSGLQTGSPQARLEIKTLFLRDLRGFIPSSARPEALDGLLSGILNLKLADGRPQAEGQLVLHQGRMDGGPLGKLSASGLEADLVLDQGRAELKNLSGRLGALPFYALGRADPEQGGRLGFRLRAGPLPLSEWSPGLGGALDGRFLLKGSVYGSLQDPQWDLDAELSGGQSFGKEVEEAVFSAGGGTKRWSIKRARFKLKDGGELALAGGALRSEDGSWAPHFQLSARGFNPPSLPGLMEEAVLDMDGELGGAPATVGLNARTSFTAGPDWKKGAYEGKLNLKGPLSSPVFDLRLAEKGKAEALLQGGGELRREGRGLVLSQVRFSDKLGKAVFELDPDGQTRTLSGALRLASLPGLRELFPGAKGSFSLKGQSAADLSTFDFSAQAPLSKDLPVVLRAKRGPEGTVLEARLGPSLEAAWQAGPSGLFRVRAEDLDLAVFAPIFFGPRSDQASLRGRLQGQILWQAGTWTSDLEGRGLATGSLAPVDFNAKLDSGKGQLHLSRAGGELVVDLERNSPRLLDFENISLGGLAWKGRVSVEKSRDEEGPFYKLTSAGLEAKGLHKGPFAAQIAAGLGGFLIKDLHWGPEFSGGFVSAKAKLDGWFEIKDKNLSEITAWGALPLDGLLSGTGRLDGPPEDPRAEGTVRVREGRIKGLPLDDIGGTLTLNQGQLGLNGALARGAGRILIQAGLDLKSPERNISVKASVQNGELGELLGFFPGDFLKSSKGQIQRALLQGQGPLSSPAFNLELEVVDGGILGLDFDALAGRMGFASGAVDLKELALRRGDGILTLRDGRLGPQAGKTVPFQAGLEAKDLELRGSRVNGVARVKGSLPSGSDGGALSLRLDAETLRLGETDFPGLGLDLVVKDSMLSLDGKNSIGQSLRGQVEFQPGGGLSVLKPLVVEDMGRKKLTVTGRFLPQGESDLAIAGRDVDAVWLNPWIPEKARGFFQGQGDLDLSLKGPMKEMLLTASLDLRNGKVGGLSYQSLIAVAQIRDGVLDLSPLGNPCRLVFQGGKSRLLVSGTFPVSGESAAEGNLQALLSGGDLSFLQLSPMVKKGSGALEFSAQVKGRWGNPMVTALDISALNGEAELGNYLPHLRELEMKVRVRDNLVQEARLEARSGAGRIHVRIPPGTADVILKGALPDPFALDVWTTQGPAQFELRNVVKKGSTGDIVIGGLEPEKPFLIRGHLSAPAFEGRLKVSNATFTWPPEEEKGGSGYSLKTVAFKMDLISGPGLVYYRTATAHTALLNVDAGQTIIIRGNASEGNLGGQGRVSTSSGTFPFGKSTFSVSEGSLNILPTASVGVVSEADYMPYLEGKAENTWRGIELPGQPGVKNDLHLTLLFRGKVNDVGVSIRSEPVLDPDPKENDAMLMELVTLGRIFPNKSSLPAGDVAKVVGSLVEDAATQSFIQGPVDEWVKKVSKGRLDFKVDTNVVGNVGPSESALGAPENPNPSLSPTPLGGRSLLDQTSVGIGLRIQENLYADAKFKYEQESKAAEARILKQLGLTWKPIKGVDLSTGINEVPGEKAGSTRMDPGFSVSVKKEFDQGDIVDPDDHLAPELVSREVEKSPGGAHLTFITTERARCMVYLKDGNRDVLILEEKDDFIGQHEVEVIGRQPDTTYDYYIRTEDRGKNTKTLGPFTLTTGR